MELVIKMRKTSVLRPPGFQIVVSIGSSLSLITKFAISVIKAVLRNCAIPIFFATLISCSVVIECYSNYAKYVIIRDINRFNAEIRIEAINPRNVIRI